MIEYPPRQEVVAYLKSVLCGPQAGNEETIEGTPFLRYLTGMLYPIGETVGDGQSQVSATAEDQPIGEDRGEEAGTDGGDAMELTVEALPSAVGLSFRIKDDARVKCLAWAACYESEPKGASGGRGRSGTVWKRRPLATPENPAKIDLKKGSDDQDLFGGLAQIVSRWRSMGDGTAIVTIALVNKQKSGSQRGLDPAKTLFQVGMRCETTQVMPYPEVAEAHESGSEEAELAFLYANATPFARGHGAAATWETSPEGRCSWVAIDFMPAVDVPYATFELPSAGVDLSCLDLQFLDSAPRERVIAALSSLPDAYRKWVEGHSKRKPRSGFEGVARDLVSRAGALLNRMEKGVGLLRANDTAWRAFHLANRAMGMHMVLSKALKNGPHALGEKAQIPKFDLKGLKWRPFQVAFMLSILESLIDEDSPDREVVDVIWFPTGGGKTEAYLLVTALELIRRRLVHGGRDTSTAVMSCYTLRLLTTQQFQRTSTLIAALELLRLGAAEELGERPFSLGLWVGDSLTPNSFRTAHDRYAKALESNSPRNPFLLLACPCCATEIFPRSPVREGNAWRASDFGVQSSQAGFRFFCPNTVCQFHGGLPLNIVDEALYAEPPSMLLGTIDKFAMLPWNDKARTFFGGPNDRSVPPSLIIQDELHLISGPLGSLAAPYEAAVDTIIRVRGSIPKRIGSTATIRNAGEQVRGLYGRKVAVFPTPCGQWDDAFFFSTERSKPGRQYVGVMGQGYIKPVVAMAWTAAALLQSVKEVKLDPETLDAYWTVLAYHNSRRELGRTLTAARDEIATRIQVIASSQARVRALREPLELSAQMVKSMTEALAELERRHQESNPAVDLVPCTSIISVGVDVDRLGVMLVNGQPKLTAEYIQASSRVGRSTIPGLIVTLFSPSKPRDRSHYEDFRAYHEAIYRHVEPTSVTPYALPARERTVHAALVAIVRHVLQWRAFDHAGDVDFGAIATQQALDILLRIMSASDPSEAADLKTFVDQRINEWTEFAEARKPLHYENLQAGMQFAALLHQFGRASSGALWPTMMSVRNVDAETKVSVN